jgi:hypothetical protein
MNWIKHALELRHLGVQSGASKANSEPTVYLAQTVHLSWFDKNTISEWTKTRFHMTHITLEFHRVRPKWFLRLGFIQHKPCNYLASRLALSSNVLNWASTWALSPRSTTRCVQNDFWACGIFGPNYAPILHRHSDCLQMDRNEIPQDPCHLVAPSGASKMISVRVVRSAQTMHLSCVKISIISNELSEASTWASLPRSTITCFQNDFWAYGMFSTNHAAILHRHQYYLQKDQNGIPHDPRHLRVPSGASKTTSEAMVRSSQTMHLSCMKISYIFEWSRSSFHLSLVTKEYHRVHPKRFLSLWYIWCKPCTYLASRFVVSPNELNQASTWASSPRSTIRCVQNDFWAYGTFGANLAPFLNRQQHYLQMHQNMIPHDPRHLGVPSGASKIISEAMVRSALTVHLSCLKISTIFKRTKLSFHLSLVT